MFKALIKAFTGRAGLFPGLLALSIIALTAAAILLSLPRIEQKLEDSAQTVLSGALTDNDVLEGFRVEGRQLQLEGEFEDAASLSAQLKEIEGVRSVLINGLQLESMVVESSLDAAPGSTPDTLGQQPASVQSREDSEATGVVDAGIDSSDAGLKDDDSVEGTVIVENASQEAVFVEQLTVNEQLIASGEPLAQPAPDSEVNASDENQIFDQSSLTLRYDGKQLSLSGHLADEQMAQLIADRVAQVAPVGSELEVNLDGNGKGSPLDWMREFLDTVSDLPDDAQGLIEGSDALGVQIIPDIEQTLAVQPPAQATVPGVGSELQGIAVLIEDNMANAVETALDEPVQGESDQPETASDSSMNMPVQENNTPESVEAESEVEVEQAPLVVPVKFITELNARISSQSLFAPGEYVVSEALAAELDGLAEMMRQHPYLLLKIVGNLDFSVGPRDAGFVGIDRAQEIRSYLMTQQIEPYRVFATPLPRDSAFDRRIQVVFYISE